jgi:hypothetical protein
MSDFDINKPCDQQNLTGDALKRCQEAKSKKFKKDRDIYFRRRSGESKGGDIGVIEAERFKKKLGDKNIVDYHLDEYEPLFKEWNDYRMLSNNAFANFEEQQALGGGIDVLKEKEQQVIADVLSNLQEGHRGDLENYFSKLGINSKTKVQSTRPDQRNYHHFYKGGDKDEEKYQEFLKEAFKLGADKNLFTQDENGNFKVKRGFDSATFSNWLNEGNNSEDLTAIMDNKIQEEFDQDLIKRFNFVVGEDGKSKQLENFKASGYDLSSLTYDNFNKKDRDAAIKADQKRAAERIFGVTGESEIMSIVAPGMERYLGVDFAKGSVEALEYNLNEKLRFQELGCGNSDVANSLPLGQKVTLECKGKTHTFELKSFRSAEEISRGFNDQYKDIEKRGLNAEKAYNTALKKSQPIIDKLNNAKEKLENYGEINSLTSPRVLWAYKRDFENYQNAIEEYNSSDAIKNLNLEITTLNNIQEEVGLLEKKGEELDDYGMLLEAGALNYNLWDKMVATIDSQFFASANTLMGSLGSNIASAFGNEELSKSIYESSLNYYKMSTEKMGTFAESLGSNDFGKVGFNFGRYLLNLGADNSFSIAATLLPGGVIGNFGGKLVSMGLQGAAKKAALASANKLAQNATMATFFVSGSGDQWGKLSLAEFEGKKKIAQIQSDLYLKDSDGKLTDKINPELTQEMKNTLLSELDFYENATSLKVGEGAVWRRIFAAVGYGGMDMIGERLGSLRVINNLQKVGKAYKARGLFSAYRKSLKFGITETLKSGYRFGAGIGSELLEESFVNLGTAFIDKEIMGLNVGYLDQFSTDFGLNTAFTSIALQSPYMASNVMSGMRYELATAAQRKSQRTIHGKLMGITTKIENAKLPGSEISKEELARLQKEKEALFQEAAVSDFVTMNAWTKLNANERQNLIEVNNEIRSLEKDYYSLTNDPTFGEAGLLNDIQDLETKLKAADAKKADILKNKTLEKYNQKTKEALKENKELQTVGSIIATGRVNFYDAVKDIATFQFEGKSIILEDQQAIDDYIKKNNITDAKKIEAFKNNSAWVTKQGEIVINESSIFNQIRLGTTSQALTAAVAPLHELLHTQIKSAGLFNEENTAELQDSVNNATLGLTELIKSKIASGDIKDARGAEILKRLESGKKRSIEEVMTVFGETILLGDIKPNEMNLAYGLKGFLNKTFTRANPNVANVLNPFQTTNDIYSFISDFATKTANVEGGKVENLYTFDSTGRSKPREDINVDEKFSKSAIPEGKQAVSTDIELESNKLKGIAKLKAMIEENEVMGPNNAVTRNARKEAFEAQIKKVDELNTQFTADELRGSIAEAKAKEQKLINELGTTQEIGREMDMLPLGTSPEKTALEKNYAKVEDAGKARENLELALQEKFAAFEGEVETAGLDIETGKTIESAPQDVLFSEGISATDIAQNLSKKGLEVSEKQINNMVGKITSRATTKFWSRMSESNQNIVPRKLYKDSARNLLLEIANNYRKEISKNTGKQVTFDAYMANTGMQRLNSLAADLGAKQKDDKSLSDEATLRKAEKQQTAQETTVAKPEVTPTTEIFDAIKSINPNIDVKDFEKKFTEAVLANAKKQGINISDPNLTPTQRAKITPYDVLAEALGMNPKKISNPAQNLNQDAKKVQRFLFKASQLVKTAVLSKAYSDVQTVESKVKGGKPVKVGGVTLGYGRNLLNEFFNQPKRLGSGKYVRTPKQWSKARYEQAIGIKDGKIDPNYVPRKPQEQMMKAILKALAEQMSLRATSRILDTDVQSKEVKATQAALDSMKPDILFSENALGNTQETLMSKFLDNTDYRNLLDKNTDTAKRKLTNIIKNALEAAIDENILGGKYTPDDARFLNEVLTQAKTTLKPLVLEAKAILTGLDLQNQLGENKFRVKNKGIETDNQKTDYQVEINTGTLEKQNWKPFNIEIKAADAQLGSITVSDIDLASKKLNLKNFNIENNPLGDDKIIKKLLTPLERNALKEIIESVLGIENYTLKTKLTPKQRDQLVAERGKDFKIKIGGISWQQLLSNPDIKGDFTMADVAKIYANKITPTYYMQIDGKGLFAIGKDIYNLGVPSLEDLKVQFYVRPVLNKSTTKADGTTYTINLRIIPQSKDLKNIEPSTKSIDKLNDQRNIVDILGSNNDFADVDFSENTLDMDGQKGINKTLLDGNKFKNSKKGKKAIQKLKDNQPEGLSKDFNDIIEQNTGITSKARFSEVVAKRRGRGKGRFRFLIPPGAEDFKGLLYNFLGKGKKGEQQWQFFDKNLLKPYWQAISQIERARRALKNDYVALLKGMPEARKKLGTKIPTKGKTDFTYDHAVRAYLMDQSGYDLVADAGLSKRDAKILVDTIKNDPVMASFARGLQMISKQDKWLKPNGGFDVQTIQSDIHRFTSGEGRKKFLENSGFMQNVDQIFSPENLRKIEAAYGRNVREALEDTLYRMKNGTNRQAGTNRLTNTFNNWINRSVGAIMFFNRKSALLQTISSVNFINWSDNNPLKAAMAFANQKQYWSDFAFIFNSPKLKERRAGLKGDINEAELADAVRGATNKAEAALSWLLKQGFLPTQMADSFAIASGGATFYRNRINTYLKQGMNQQAAEKKAWEDFSRISEESQQSADPAMISEQQASPLGRFTLNFQNTPMQYTRLMKRAGQDLINRRRIPGLTQAQSDATYISKIIYYGAVQNFIFAALQNALFAVVPGFGGEDDEEELMTKEQKQRKKEIRIANNMVDTLLRGTGIYGAIAATLKNTIIKFYENEGKDPFAKDNADIIIEAANLSPVIGSKLRKLNNALKTREFEKDVIEERGWEITKDGRLNLSPSYNVLGSTAEALLNVPLERTIAEIDALVEMTDQRNSSLERIALALGWRTWDIGVPNEEEDQIKVEIKERKKQERKDKLKKEREEKKRLEEEKRFEGLSNKEINNLKRRDQIEILTKQQQIDSLIKLGVSKKDIRALRLESDRIDKIIELNTK